MKTAIIHFSDIHFKANNNSIEEKKSKIYDAIKNEILNSDQVFMVLSGDIAFSGRDEEYQQAMELFEGLKNKLHSYTKNTINCLLIPGNHDCDYNVDKNEVRETVINKIQEENCVKDGFIDLCCKVQSKFFEFREMCQDEGEIIYCDKLLMTMKYLINDKAVIFYCYNTSWMSIKADNPGRLYFPLDTIPDYVFSEASDLSVSILHHPFNWQLPANMRNFKKHIEETSDIIITGHEHVSGKYLIDNLEGNITEYIEGAVLQDTSDPNKSGFNLILLDLSNKKQRLFQFDWNGKIYSIKDGKKEWRSYIRNERLTKKLFKINLKFEKQLMDPGVTFGHPQKPDLSLNDIFIWPSIRSLGIDEKDSKVVVPKPISAEILCKKFSDEYRILIIGSEKAGKTTFCKVAFNKFYYYGLVPILIDGDNIRGTSDDDITKVINRRFANQYSADLLEKFSQLDNSQKIIIIDDFDTTRLNLKYKTVFLERLNKIFPNIIITANDFYTIEEIISAEKTGREVFESYDQYKLIEFGHYLRNKLIDKWNKIGREETIDEKELLKKNDEFKNLIDIIIGKNFVPSHPFFLLIILQSIETGIPHNLKESSYGYYYDFLITQALGNINAKNEEIDAYYNYISEFANYLFQNKKREITQDKLEQFHNWYCSEYDVSPKLESHIASLIKAKIIKRINGVIKFRYKYLFYYFIAKYFANNISLKQTKDIISMLCDKLHVEEFANIIMFLTHLSKDPFVFKEVLARAQSIFGDLQPIKLENDIDTVNRLMKEIPILIIEDKTPKQVRDEKYKSNDKSKQIDKKAQDNDEDDFYDYEQQNDDIDFVAKLNLSYKCIEIIGQILKNYYGSIRAERKIELGEEAYFLGLRSLKIFYDILGENKEYIIEKIKKAIDEKKISDTNKIEATSRKLLFAFFDILSYVFIKKISGFIGNEHLKRTYQKILEKNNTTAINLVDIAIKLQFYSGFPNDDINRLKERFKGNSLATIMLKRFVIDYLYMYPVSYQDKQRICNKLEIPMKKQRYIERETTQRKRQKNPNN